MNAGRTKVVCLLDSLVELGGAETLAVEMIIRLPADRFDRILVLTRWSDELAEVEPSRSAIERAAKAGVRVIGLRRSSRLAVRPWIQLVRFLRRERPDILHAHKFGSNMWGALFGTLTGVPVIVAHEHMWSYSGRAAAARGVIDRELIARLSDAFVAVSELGRKQMIELQRIDPEVVTFIPNGVPERPPGDGQRIRAELGIAPDTPVVGTVGNLRPEKALDVLVDAAGELVSRGRELRVLIAGEGGERQALEGRIASLGLEDVVTLLGYRVDVPDLLAAFDIAVCCSDYEGGPLSVMEYMDASLPVVATKTGGLPELLGEDETGRLIPTRDPGALAEALDELLGDPDLRAELGAAAKARRQSLYGIDGWVEAIESLYADLLAAKRSQTAA